MELNLVEALLLIALDDEKGKFIGDSTKLAYSLGGAILLDLSQNGQIRFDGELVKYIKSGGSSDQLALEFLEKIKKSSKERKINYWIEKFGNQVSRIKKHVLQKMVERGVLEKREEKVLWVFSRNKYPAQNSTLENEVRTKLYQVVMEGNEPTEQDVLLLSLLKTGNLLKEIFGENVMKDEKIMQKIDLIVTSSSVSGAIQDVIKSVEAALTAVMIITTMNTTTTIT